MLEPFSYEFPSEDELFVHQAYLTRAKAISAKSAAEHRKIAGMGIALGAACFLSLLSLGFVGAAVVDQGRENWTNTRIANVEP